jgi:hypothetical protein
MGTYCLPFGLHGLQNTPVFFILCTLSVFQKAFSFYYFKTCSGISNSCPFGFNPILSNKKAFIPFGTKALLRVTTRIPAFFNTGPQ